jgi:esterase/lipase/1-acyl-sn-glycerol-3-phosphate acyltransferase
MTGSKTFRYTAIALKILEKLLGSKFSVSGLENLPNQPILFVANHFTRSETFFVPYVINKHTGRQVRCLADSSLFHGVLGKFLNSVGTVSTRNPHRDNMIVKDLVTGDYDWMIYPEGSMIKNKEIKKEASFVSTTPDGVGRVRTGSAVLALKSELYRTDIIEAFNSKNVELLDDLEKKVGIKFSESLKNKETYIVPLSITYYPIRPGDNKIKALVARLVKKIPKQIAEELEIEGNILLGADININFGKPISVSEYIKDERKLIYQIPIIKNDTKINFILKYFKFRITNEFMSKIYSDIQINLDHLFSASLIHIKREETSIMHLKRAIYLSAITLAKLKKYRLNPSILEEKIFKIFIDEENKEFDEVFELAEKQGLITKINNEKIKINKSLFYKKYGFHDIRRENTLLVVANEFSLLQTPNDIVKRNIRIADASLKKKVFDELLKHDLENYDFDYKKYFDAKFSKDKSIGSPFFLDTKDKTVSKIKKVGILLCHGYKSSPKEVEALAKFINGFGFKVYVVRLKGHGTAPLNMKDITWHDWYNSLQRGYAALNNICTKIVMVGFSTGGLLSLLSASRKKKDLEAIIAINSALKLRDIRTRVVSGINIWNEMLEKLHINKGKFEYVDDEPENPNMNYSRNYLKGVEELENLMKECNEFLDKVTTPALIIQAKNDPVVSPLSGKIIYQKIRSKNKFLFEPNFSNHVIINRDNKEEVFEEIRSFLYKLNLL